MRRPTTQQVPPICKSKHKELGIITTCACPDCTDCTSVSYYDVAWSDFEPLTTGEINTCGSWSWSGDYEHQPDQGTWNNCAPPGQGTGLASIYQCNGTYSGTFPATGITYPAWLLSLHQNFVPGWYWIGTWTSDSTGKIFPTNGSGCP